MRFFFHFLTDLHLYFIQIVIKDLIIVPLLVNFVMEKKRNLVYFRNYFWEFYDEQPERLKKKINYVLFLISTADPIPAKFFEQISGYKRLFAIRIEFESNIYRIFCCIDKGNIIVLFNAFQKKTRKTPKKEIDRGMQIMQEYFEFKKSKKQL